MAKGKKTGGRTKGQPNKLTVEQKQRIESVLSILDQTLDEDLALLSNRERVLLWKDLQEYIRPKLARQELTGKDGKDLFENVIVKFVDGPANRGNESPAKEPL